MACKTFPLFFFIFLWCCLSVAQTAPVQLDAVTIADRQLLLFSESKNILSIPDSVIRRNSYSLSSLLNYESLIYFKENGPGMVSSASFRGTTAQQTAVVWNGININSQLNGQTEFNTLTGRDYSEVSVRVGGGSLQYGSSAIGGTVHLNTDVKFVPVSNHTLELGYGSYQSAAANYRLQYSNLKFSSMVSISGNQSDNDYRYPGQQRYNENGQFQNIGYNAAFGYRIDDYNSIKLYSQVFSGDRHFSLIQPTDNKTRYLDLNSRNLLEWNRSKGKFVSNLKAAFLTERYRYFENILLDDYFTGKVQTMIGKYDLSWHINNSIRLNAVVDYTVSSGSGSDIGSTQRNILSAALLLSHQLGSKLSYETGIRAESGEQYSSPLLFSAGARYHVNSFYQIKAHVSGNYRMPTFNDLYWHNGGNPDLLPEQSVQVELGNHFKYGHVHGSLTVYHNNIRDMIRWLPQGGGFSRPENTDQVTVTGAEVVGGTQFKTGSHHFAVNAGYSYTHSRNDKLGKQLIYVPYHKARASIQYDYRRFSARMQHLFTGSVFTQSDNDPSGLVGLYHVTNLDINYAIGKRSQYLIGSRIGNLWNETYESDEGRPFPGTNVNMYLTFNF